MAESAGLVLGVISLGLEVCKGIITYTDAIRSQSDDLKALEQHAKALEISLSNIKNFLRRLDTSNTSAGSLTINPSPTSIRAVREVLISSQSSLDTLHSFVVDNACGCSISDPTFKERCKVGYKRLIYGFKGKKKAEMEACLSAVNSTLLVAWKGVEADISIAHSEHLQAVQSETKAIAATFDTHAKLTEASVNETSDALSKIQTDMCSVQQTSAAIHEAMSTALPTIETTIQQSTLTFSNKADAIQSKIEALTTAKVMDGDSNAMMKILQKVEQRTAFLDNASFTAREGLALQRLMARPSQLNAALDDMSQYRSQKALLGSNKSQGVSLRQPGYPCDCVAYRTTQTWTMRLGFANVSRKAVETIRHRPTCRYSTFEGDWQQKQTTFSASIMGFCFALDIALSLSCGWNRGAGGFSISPMMSYDNVDSERQSMQKEVEWLISSSINKLRKLYDSGRASRHDVNDCGHNPLNGPYLLLLNGAAKLPRENRHYILAATKDWGLGLMHQYGVPVLPSNKPGALIDDSWTVPGEQCKRELISIIPPDYIGAFPCSTVRFYRNSKPDHGFLRLLDMDILTEAIMLGHNAVLHQMLRDQPQLAQSDSPFGSFSYLALSIDFGCAETFIAGLKATESGQITLAELLSRREPWSGSTHAEYALSACQVSMNQDSPSAARSIQEVASHIQHMGLLKQILQEQSVLCNDSTEWLDQSEFLECCIVYATEIKARRQALKELARRKLSPRRLRALGLDGHDLLDIKTGLVVQSLRKNFVEVPEHFITECDTSSSKSVFHTVKSVTLAEAYMRVGFGNLEARNFYGYTPLEHFIRYEMRPWSDTDLIVWFIDHGVVMSRVVSAAWGYEQYEEEDGPPHPIYATLCRGSTMAHLVAAELGSHKHYLVESDYCRLKRFELIRKADILSSPSSDGVTCICAPGGRRPFNYLVQSLLSKEEAPTANTLLKGFFLLYAADLSTFHYKTAFRVATINMLSIQHTCCDQEFQDDDSSKSEDIEHDDFTILLLEDIMSRMGEMMARHEMELMREEGSEGCKSGRSPVINSNGEAECKEIQGGAKTKVAVGVEIIEIWCDTWLSAVNIALDTLYERDVTAGKVQAAEQLGVRWHTTPEPGSESDFDEEDWDWCVQQIEKTFSAAFV